MRSFIQIEQLGIMSEKIEGMEQLIIKIAEAYMKHASLTRNVDTDSLSGFIGWLQEDNDK